MFTQGTVGHWTGLLEAVLSWLGTLQKEYEQFPVIPYETFSELLRSQVNILASDQQISSLLTQLHAMGEVFCIRDLIVLSVRWLSNNLLADLFSSEFFLHARTTGVYTLDDFQSSYNQCDALLALDLLQALDICVKCDMGEEIEYELPIYNRTETLEGLWDSQDNRYCNHYSKYGGIRLYTPPGTTHLFKSVFPHCQVELRRANRYYDDCDLYQWYQGSKLCNNDLESLITLYCDNTGQQCIEIKMRGPPNSSQSSFYFFERTCAIVERAIVRVCPGLLVEKHVLSCIELKSHSEVPYCYPPDAITAAMLETESTLDVALFNPNIDSQETITDLIMFGNLREKSQKYRCYK